MCIRDSLAYYDVGTGMPNRSMFERDFTEEISENRSGAVIAVEFSNLKSISEIYGFESADDILKSCAEYILALPCSSQKKVYRFSSDILFISLSGIPVSYTHLDVYKRQPETRVQARSRACQPSGCSTAPRVNFRRG